MKKIYLPLLSLPLCFGLLSCDGESSDETILPAQQNNQIIPLPNDFGQVSDQGTAPAPPLQNDGALESRVENEIFSQINSFRSSRGLSPLTLDARLSSLEDTHNTNMAAAGRSGASLFGLSHDGFDSRANVAFSLGYGTVGENVAALKGYPAAQLAQTFVQNWIDSPGHLQNIVAAVSGTGVAVYVDPVSGVIYASQIFGG